MDFQLTEQQEQLRETARRFAREQLPEVAAEIERTGDPPSRSLLKQYADLGFLGINVPEQFGGLGLGKLEALIVLELFADVTRQDAGTGLQCPDY